MAAELVLTDRRGLSDPMVVSGHAVAMGRFDNLTNKQANEYFAYSITVGLMVGMVLGLVLDQVGLGIVVGFAAGTGVGLWFLSKRVPDGPGDVDGA
ncbi:hypothetical protein [Humibacillus sp. DSM 29435]|uniref:hypothetical protein n=1 Tax=Humibacillus sp. DSM 29435 TaxID=1869167 RepID=UPI0011130B8E|nr:hypothetical protein [Humibacillus sp. DSM 29435]